MHVPRGCCEVFAGNLGGKKIEDEVDVLGKGFGRNAIVFWEVKK